MKVDKAETINTDYKQKYASVCEQMDLQFQQLREELEQYQTQLENVAQKAEYYWNRYE